MGGIFNTTGSRLTVILSLVLIGALGISSIFLIRSYNANYNSLIDQAATVLSKDADLVTKSGPASKETIKAKLMQIKPATSAVLPWMVFIFVVVVPLMGYLIYTSVQKPLKEIKSVIEGAVAGDDRNLTIRLPINRKDDFGVIASVLNTFFVSLDEIIRSIGRKTETVTAASSEVFMVSEQMNEESSDLSMKSNSVAAAAEEMNSSMHSVAAASEEASTNISIVADAAVQMQTNIKGVAANCDEAKKISSNAMTQVESATDKVGHLGDAAKEIGNVTQVITDIAEQTNLLALNATIEAARAGEAGKGFAVVAGEIKNLAAQTSEATSTIREKIDGIQASTHETVSEVGNISEVINHVDQIVNEIVSAIEEQSGTASEVASNIEQASAGISEVNENVAQISQVSAEIAADIARVDTVASDMSDRAGMMTKGAGDLDNLALNLREMISLFRVSVGEDDDTDYSSLKEEDIPDIMPWSSRLALSIDVIDNHHKELVRMINQLHKAMRMQKGTGKVAEILGALLDYTVFHFGFEEQLFDRFGYPETAGHKKIHQKLIGQIADFKDDLRAGKSTVTMELMDFLKDWLKEHILKTDMAYVPFMKENMAKDTAWQNDISTSMPG